MPEECVCFFSPHTENSNETDTHLNFYETIKQHITGLRIRWQVGGNTGGTFLKLVIVKHNNKIKVK